MTSLLKWSIASVLIIFLIFLKKLEVYIQCTDRQIYMERQTDRQTLVLGGQTPDSRGMSEQSGANGRSLVS